MQAITGVQLWVAFAQGGDSAPVFFFGAGDDDVSDAAVLCALQYLGAVVIKDLEIEVAVGVD